jgi:hypothetical protein
MSRAYRLVVVVPQDPSCVASRKAYAIRDSDSACCRIRGRGSKGGDA